MSHGFETRLSDPDEESIAYRQKDLATGATVEIRPVESDKIPD